MRIAFGMAKINWRESRVAYLIAGILFVTGLVQYIIDVTINAPGNQSLAAAGYLTLLPLLMGIFVAARNFPKLMRLGGKRLDFWKCGVLTFAPIAAAVSLVMIVCRYTVDRLVFSTGRVDAMLDLLAVFGFINNGAVWAFFQMTAFLLLLAVVAHTLTLIQGRWYGWATDALIIAIISVFTPIAPLRAALVWFFRMIIFNDSAIVQILSCAVLGAAVYCAGLIPIARRQI